MKTFRNFASTNEGFATIAVAVFFAIVIIVSAALGAAGFFSAMNSISAGF